MNRSIGFQLKCATLFAAIFFAHNTSAQSSSLKSPPNGGNKKAMVAERICITDVTIQYNRPGVKGREGKIYGTPVVHEGFIDITPQYGTSTASPWRAGANENTTIEFSTDVKVEGKDLAAGKYGFFVAYGPQECTVIFSKDKDSWGGFFYDEKHDALRATVKPVKSDKSTEWLKYEFTAQTDSSAVVALQWEKLTIPFKIEVDPVKTTLESYHEELKGDKGFSADNYLQASSFCLSHSTDLSSGLKWAQMAVLFQKDFKSLNNLSQFNAKLGNPARADSLSGVAMSMGSMMELHLYGRQLLASKQPVKALEVFKLNAKKHPKEFTTYIGLARGYSANGDYKTAMANAKAGLPLAPNAPNKQSISEMIKKLESGKDVN